MDKLLQIDSEEDNKSSTSLHRILSLPPHYRKDEKQHNNYQTRKNVEENYKKFENETSSSNVSTSTEEMVLISSPIIKTVSSSNMKDEQGKSTGTRQSGKESTTYQMSETSDVVNELLEIVDAESVMVNQKREDRGSSGRQSPVSNRLRAVVQNWRTDESLALSANDSWSLRSEVRRNSVISKVPGTDSDASTDLSQYLPIRQRLRESWRTREHKKKHVIRKLNASSTTTDALEEESLESSSSHYQRHLLPHPDDLVLVGRQTPLDQISDLDQETNT